MINNKIHEKFSIDEHEGEKLICIIRLALAVIYITSMPIVSIFRYMEGYEHIPMRAHIMTSIFLLYSVYLFYYVRKTIKLHNMFKYICVFIDMTIISAAIWVTCTYPLIAPPITFLSIQALFYSIIILAGSFRYSTRCIYFSGIYAGIAYMTVVIINRNTLDLPYFFMLEDKRIDVTFPVYNEFFRVLGIIVTGWVTGLASKRRFFFFNTMINAQASSTRTSLETVEHTRSTAKSIRESTDEIFLSSKDIFSAANNQAVNIQEIETTISENSSVSADITDKTGSVANIASRMENDIYSSFSQLKLSVNQMEEIKKTNDNVISGIIELGNKIVNIRNFIKSINIITDQTKVIAFNAALEASSAGEQGKRFSVVASEVNRLADDIAMLTNQIRTQIDEIQSSSSTLIISSEESADKITKGNILIKELEEIFHEIRSGAKTTASQAQSITTFTQKQQQSSAQINIAIADISNGLNSFLRSTEAVTGAAGNLTKMIDELDEILSVETE
ncbi:MAG: methyl-accepting chemotaxis protein [Treponema sp.]|jgi:methyl-accepting chemotaxis protein|nr:methyl-accepting chemotaxis protein [Treponema sp.]